MDGGPQRGRRPWQPADVADATDPIRSAGLLRVAERSSTQGDAVRRAARRGGVRRVRRGAYVGAERWEGAGDSGRHLLRARAAVAAARTPVLVSHRSAAEVWGLPVVGVRDERVHLTFTGTSGGVSRGDLARHVTRVPLEAVVVDGLRVTDVARTVLDLARTCGFLAGVVAGDAALRTGLVTSERLEAEVVTASRGRGVRVARDVLGFVDARSESPGESLSRVRMAELGLPAPELQHVVRDGHGFVARVDFWWEGARVVGEFDGRSKYGFDDDARTAAGRLWDEKVREDRVRDTRVRVVRWTWADAWAGTPMVTRLHRAGVR